MTKKPKRQAIFFDAKTYRPLNRIHKIEMIFAADNDLELLIT